MSLLRRILAAFSTLLVGRAERDYRRSCQSRPVLTVQEFHEQFYRTSGIPLDTCEGVLHVLRVQLKMANVRPDDRVTEIFVEIDLEEICFELGDEFGMRFSDDDVERMDGTVDSLIRETHRLRTGPKVA